MPNLRGASPDGRDDGDRSTWHGRVAAVGLVNDIAITVGSSVHR